MRNLSCKPLALALACLLAPAGPVVAATTPSSIPLDIIREGSPAFYAYRLGINVGVNGGQAKEYLFDTGSDSFNIDVGLSALGGTGPAWFPTQPGATTGPLHFYLYGDGTYGYVQSSTTVSSMQFYNATTGAKVADYDTSAGAPVAINYAYATTTSTGFAWGTIPGIGTLYNDKQFQQNLANGVAPEEGHFYGIFGAGDFGNGVPGMLGKSGYIVEANGTGKAPGNCGAACFIEGLTPELRAQFLTKVPWIGGAQGKFALSGANSASQFDTEFNYVLSQGNQVLWQATYPTLFDTGTPDIMLIDNDDGFPPGVALNPGITLTASGNVKGAYPASVVSGDPSSGDYTNVIGIGPYGGFPDGAIYGISFFFHNAVMYDLANQQTAYTPFFVTAAPVTASLDVTPDMGMLGLAGKISGNGSLAVESGAVANLSAANTYTGKTAVAQGGWLGLAGPGSIADSSGLDVNGVFDISRTSHTTQVRTLSGSGYVQLGDATLDLTHARGTFSGHIMDGGLGGGQGGRLAISGGQETLSGENVFTGLTGISAPASLTLAEGGSLAGSVVNLGTFVDNGQVHGSVLDSGMLQGHGRIDGSLAVAGVVAPGQGQAGKASYRTLSVGGDYTQTAQSGYLAQIDLAHPGVSSKIDVAGSANVVAGARLGIAAAPAAVYQAGARYTVLQAAGGVSGRYALVKNLELTPVLGLAIAGDANHAYVDIATVHPLPGFGHTRNQVATLSGAQSLSLPSPLYNVLANQPSAAAIRAAADQLSGEIHADAQYAFLNDSHYLRDAVSARLDQGMGVASMDGPKVKTGADGQAWWGEFVGAWGRHDGDGNAARMKDSLSGVLLGHDMAVGRHGRFGVLAGYTQTSMHVDARHSHADSRDLHLGVYGGTRIGQFVLGGGLAFSRHDLKTRRSVAIAHLSDRARVDYKARTTQVFGEAGYAFRFRHGFLEPMLRAAYVQLTHGGFREHGDSEALIGRSDRHGVTFTTLGARAATRFGSGARRFTWHGMLGWRHASDYLHPATRLAFEGGNRFTTFGVPIARNAAVLDAGLSVRAAHDVTFDLSYQGQVSRHATDSGFHMGLNWQF